jgi:periplasmic protein TonB
MFEDSLVASRVSEVSSSRRWATLASIGLQVVVAGVVIALPLLHPEVAPFRLEAPKVWMPLMPKPPVPVVQVQRQPAASSSSSMAAPIATRRLILPSSLPSAQTAVADAPSLLPFGSGMGTPDGLPNGIGVGDGHGPVVTVAPAKAPVGRLRVSFLSEGMLIAPIRPVYPMIAKAAGVQGTVVVEAIISRTGTIESLHVVSGPPMLQSAALEAIREARYQPYRLNGEPTEVETRITVNFRMGG